MKDVMKELAALKLKHKKKGRSRAPRVRANFPNLKVESKVALSNTLTDGGFKRDLISEHKWKKGREESAETIKEIEAKAKRIRPLYSKGAYQYPSETIATESLSIHRKGG